MKDKRIVKERRSYEMEQKERKELNNKGITLISLVITIIVLLILAGVSIAMLTGENGILTQAQKAKTETEDSKEDELRRLTSLEAAINLENKTYEDKDGQIAIIPAGFAVSQVEGENTIKDGLVIIDSKGNEFVWIPVTSDSQYMRNRSYEYAVVSENATTDTGYLPDGIQRETDESENNEEIEKETVLNSGGFYISRYEAGKEGNNTLISKKGATVWDGISQLSCKEVAKTFINNENVKSALCSGIQWDMTMNFVDGKDDGIGNKFDKEQADEKNRHLGGSGPMTSGQNEADKVCNIYDLEGNCVEFVAEKSLADGRYPAVNRGGYYSGIYSASNRTGGTGNGGIGTSFRCVLYVMQ